MRTLRFSLPRGSQTAESFPQCLAFQVNFPIFFAELHVYSSLDTDPYEKNNIFEDNKDIVWTLLEKLAQYDANSVPTYYPDRDPAADPAAHDGWWGPWKAGPNNWPR